MTEKRKRRVLSIRDIDRTASFGGQYQPVPTFEAPKPPLAPPAQTAPQIAKPTERPSEPENPAPPAQPRPADHSTPAPPTTTGTKTAEQPKRRENVTEAPMKRVPIHLAPKASQRAALEEASTDKISVTDILRLAGRKTIAEFTPTAKYIEAPDVQRLGGNYIYKTSKNVEQRLLDKLHATNNPLGLLSDFTMIRGQLEPLFWAKLDELLGNLKTRKKD